MPSRDYVEGLVFFLLMLAAVLAAAWLLLRRRYPQLGGSAAIAAFGMLASLGLLAVHIVPAALGELGRGSVFLASLLWLVGAFLVRRVAAEPSPPPEPARAGDRFEWAFAGLAVAALAMFAAALARNQLTTPTPNSDALSFHLPGVAAWIESGSIWQIDTYIADVSPGHYPNNGDVFLLSTILPWRNDFLAHFAMWPVWALTGVAVYALARELRASQPAAVLAGSLILAIPAVAAPALIGTIVDALMLFGFATGILFLVRHARTGATSELVLAGLALGVSFGTKWYGVSSVVAVVAVWAVARYVALRELATVVRQLLAVVGLVALSGGIWLLRNLVESGNPVFPVNVSPFGITIFDAPPDPFRERFGFTITDYLTDWNVWGDQLLPQFRDALGAPALLLAVLALVTAVLFVRSRQRGHGRRRGRARLPRQNLAFIGVATFLLLTAIYVITPYSAGGPEGLPAVAGADTRYWVPALIVAAPLAAWLAMTTTWGPRVFAVLALLAVIDGLYLVASGEVSAGELRRRDVVAAGRVAVLLAGVAWVVFLFRDTLRSAFKGRPRRIAAVAACALGLVLAVGAAGGKEVQERYNAQRFIGRDRAIDWVLANAPGRRRVGLAGVWPSAGIPPVYPAFGWRLRNDVAYVGRFEDDVLRRYRSEDAFADALRTGGYDVLIVGRGRVPQPVVPEERWALSAGYRVVARSKRLTVFSGGRAPAAATPG